MDHIAKVADNVFRVLLDGETYTRVVSTWGFDSPTCDGIGCVGWCAHIEAVDAFESYDDSDEPDPQVWEKA